MKKESFPSNKRCACIINPYAANKKWVRNRLVRNYIKKNIPGKITATPKNKEYTIQTAKRLCED